MLKRWTWLWCIGAVGCQATATMPDPDPTRSSPPPNGVPRYGALTLITGDRVIVSPGTGTAPDIRVEPGPGRAGVGHLTQRRGAAITVIPNDVHELVADGRLDPALFEVSELIAGGYGDDARGDLPLIVTGRSDSLAWQRRAASPELRLVHAMPVLRAIAVRQTKARAGAALAELRRGADPTQRIWLDRKLELELAESVGQIGAPTLWDAGTTGAGVVVAVLDSGIDTTHPDLTGIVVDSQDFVEDGKGTSDSNGHGTHVASIIAGRGTASNELYRGVAPGAQLISGRVCDHLCPESAILAAMEWAVVTKGARIVNMSLGGGDRQGTDPTEAAVDQLSAQYGALFVISAGNNGAFRSVSSPSSADAALSVGAVDDDDQLTPFSSRGPRVGDGAVKPDLTAPGDGIVAARATLSGPPLGEPVGTAYQRLSGTSMAAPHVSGAAALLLQRHPAWTGAQLKAALIASAAPQPGAISFEQGAGRVDVARAARQDVTAEPLSLGLGSVSWPHDDDPPVVRTITYRNAGAAPVTLSLAGSLPPVGEIATPPGMLAIEPATLVVPAGGTADATITVDTSLPGAPDALYGGAIVATAASDVRVVTALGVERGAEEHGVTLRVIDANGMPGIASVVVSAIDGSYFSMGLVDGEATRPIPPGRYSSYAFFFGDVPCIMMHSRAEISEATVLEFDCRDARRPDVTVAGTPLEPRESLYLYYDKVSDFSLTGSGVELPRVGHIGPDAPDEVFAWLQQSASPPGDTAGAHVYTLAHGINGRYFDGWTEVIPPSQLAVVHADHAGEPGKRYLKRILVGFRDREDNIYGGPPLGAQRYSGPFRRTEYYYGPGLVWAPVLEQEVARPGFPGLFNTQIQTGFEFRPYLPGHTYTEQWNRAPFGPSLADRFRTGMATRDGDVLRLAATPFADDARRHSLAGEISHALYRNGVPLPVNDERDFPDPIEVPPGPALYRYELTASRSPEVSRLSSRVTAAWTFTSQHTESLERLPLPVIRFEPALDEQNRARRELPLVLPVAIVRPPGAPEPPIAHVAIEVSFDDGATWKSVPGIRLHDRWFGVVLHPPGAAFASLRGSASDLRVNRVEQTILRAYELKP